MTTQRKVKRKITEEQRLNSETLENDYEINRNDNPEQNSKINDKFADVIESGEVTDNDPELHQYDLGLRDWFLKNQLENQEFKVSLYRYINPSFGDRKSLVFQWEGTMPSEHEIGITYGSGRYSVFVTLTDKTGKRRIYNSKFRISEEYDKLKNGVIPQAQQANSTANFDATFNLIAKVITLFQPLLVTTKGNGDNKELMKDILMDNYKATNEILKRSAIDNTQFYNDIQRRAIDLPEVVEDEEESTGISQLIQQIAPLIERFLPVITGKADVKQKAAIGLIRELPEYTGIIKDRKKTKALITFIDKQHGQEVTDRLLKKLGLTR